MSVSNDLDWSQWTCLPTTNGEVGLDELKGLQFAYPRNDYKFSDWFNQLQFIIHDQNIGRTFQIFGYPMQEFTVFRSGPAMSWDYIIENIPESNVMSDAIPIYAVDFPKQWQNRDYPCPRLEIRAVRGAIQYHKKINTLVKYGTYVVVGFAVWKVGYDPTDGTMYENRLTANIIQCQVFKDNEIDVDGVETRLEFFYLNKEMQTILRQGFQHLTPSDPAWNTYQVGDFMVGMSSCALIDGECYFSNYTFWFPTQDSFGEWLPGLPTGQQYDKAFGDGAETGGYEGDPGTHDFHSDDIVHTGAPTLSALSAGFVNAYKVSASLLQNLGACLFPSPYSIPPTGVADGLKYIVDAMYNKGAIDYVIDCHIVPVNVPASTYTSISCGGKQLINPATDTVYGAYAVDGMYVTKSCGSITTPEAYGNFLDYTVRCKLYLPCYGYVDIPPEYWNGGTISVDYIFNIFDGTFVACVKGRSKHSHLNSLIGQYSGSACTHIPVNGRDYSQVISGLATIAVGTGVGLATGGSALGLAGLGTAGSGLGAVLGSKQPMVSSGSSNSSSAMMMHKKPYLIIEYPTSQFSTRYPKEKGLPLNVEGTLGQFGGMTIAENPILNGIPCTENEKIRIKNALKEGLIF